MSSNETFERGRKWYERKSAIMSRILGAEHNVVMHAMIPYSIGGPLDLYYYPAGMPGTGIATKELCELPGEGSRNRCFDCYELVMFTRHPLDLDAVMAGQTPIARAHRTISAILNATARFSAEVSLNPGDTCEFPADMDRVGGKCLVFDRYGSGQDDDAGTFGLLLVIEVFRSEMEFSRQTRSHALVGRLMSAGVYPYSELDREPVA